MRNIFKRKSKFARGPSRSPAQRLKDEQAKIDVKSAIIWAKYLETHPTYAMEIAKQKFGSFEQPELYSGEETSSSDPLEVLKQAREIRELVKEDVSEGKGVWDILPSILRALPEAIQGIKAMQQPPPLPQTEYEPRQIERPTPPKELSPEEQKQASIIYIRSLLSQEPADVAADIYLHRNDEGDARKIAYAYITEHTFEELLDMLPMVSQIPEWEFLAEVIGSVDSKWLATLYDEILLLKAKETEGNNKQNEGI